MVEIFKSPLAQTDLKEIWHFSFQAWGMAQADKYLEQMELGIQQLADNPELGKRCDDICTGYRCLHINRHVVCYRLYTQRIEIIRVLHERMDPWRHLEARGNKDNYDNG